MYRLSAHSVVSSHCVSPIFVASYLLMHYSALCVLCLILLNVSMYLLITWVPFSFNDLLSNRPGAIAW